KELLNRWDDLEGKYGLALPVRISAALLATDPTTREQLTLIGGQGNELGTISLLLWARGGEVRQHSLQTYNQYGRLRRSDPAVLRGLIADTMTPTIDIGAVDWRPQLSAALAQRGMARLTATAPAQRD